MEMLKKPNNPGLKKLPTQVRNKMGYAKKGGAVQSKLKEFSQKEDAHYIILCGHYEGFDQRVHEYLVDYEFSIGKYVLSGGELPALVLVDGITRLIPGVLGNEQSLVSETFNTDTPDYPQYTKPENFNGWKVPDVLLSGNHQKIKQWRQQSE